MFDWGVFGVIFGFGSVLAVLMWHILRSIERVVNPVMPVELIQQVRKLECELNRTKTELDMLRGRVEALRIDVEVLHDHLIRELREPVRRD